MSKMIITDFNMGIQDSLVKGSFELRPIVDTVNDVIELPKDFP